MLALYRADAGFTLLEVMVALVIAVLALEALSQGTASGLANTAAASRYEEALELARSQLAELANAQTFVDADLRGDVGSSYHWEHRVALIAAGSLAPGPSGQPQDAVPRPSLWAISVAITWNRGHGERGVRLETRRIGSAQR